MRNPNPSRYREADVALWPLPGTYRALVRKDTGRLLLRSVTGRSDRVEPYLDRAEADRLVAALAPEDVEIGWDGDVLTATLTERSFRVAPNEDGLYPVGDLHDSDVIEWTEPFPRMPPEELDAAAIVELLDTPLPEGRHSNDRQPVWDELHRRADADALVEALGRVRTEYARERICVLLAQHRRPGRATDGLDALAALLDHDHHVASSAAYGLRELVSRAGHERAAAAVPDLESRLRSYLEHERRCDIRTDVAAALGALTGEAPANPDFVRVARAGLDFLVPEYGFGRPTIDDGGWGTDVIYRTDRIGVVARAEWRDRYAEVLLVRLEDGDVPTYLGNEATLWLAPERVTGTEIPTYDADSRKLSKSFAAWATALRGCEEILRGDVDAFDRARRAAAAP